MNRTHIRAVVWMGVISILGGCGGGEPAAIELKIERPEIEERTVDQETGMVTRQFPVSSYFLTRELAEIGVDRFLWESTPPDPFAGPTEPVPAPGQKILEAFGIEFPEGSRAEYDKDSGILTVEQTPEWMDMIEAILDRAAGREMITNVRAEIYEAPAALALRLEQSVSDHYDHEPELLALQEVVESGEARFITSANLQARSGQRSVHEAAEEVIYFAGYSWDKEVEPARLKPEFETRNVGTRLEIDAVIGPDRQTIDVNFSLEHHTASPSWTSTSFPYPGEDEPVSVELPHFHVKTMVSQISFISGDTKLLGSWRPTGLPEFEDADVMRIVFLRADVQQAPVY